MQGVQLSENTIRRLDMLERWRIDPDLIKFQEGALRYEGRYGIVSRGIWEHSLDGQEEGLGSDGETSRAVAVKKMKVDRPDEVVQVLGLTIREAEFLVELSHDNIIELLGFVEDVSNEMVWLVFPWEDNGNLKAFIASNNWEIPERISLIDDVSSGLEYLHSREPPIVHGDLKSLNILVNSECLAVITDFGSAHHPVAKSPREESDRATQEPQPAPSLEATLDPSTQTITLTSNRYTLRWAAPELLREEDASLASDMWAFGCVAYEVITESIPFGGVGDAHLYRMKYLGHLWTTHNYVSDVVGQGQ